MHDAIPTYGVAIDNGNTLLVQKTRRINLNAYFPLQFALMAIFFLYIGVRVIASKRPLLLPSKVFFLFMVFAFTPQIIDGIMNGHILFALDAQQYLQGYLPVILMNLYITNKNTPAYKMLETGPSIINIDNALEVLALSKKGSR